ncbi:MAG: hypothetical protein H6Q90_5143 [Deltaproteobacteria bacterium]|nr:hypothetical protein [Deltaproteobacteria bacterium]
MSVRSILVSSFLLAAIVVAPAFADKAERPNPTFAGKIMLSDKRFPQQAKSLAAFNAQVKKQSKMNFSEDKDKKWKIYFAGFLKTALNDVEYMVKLYELTGKGQQLLVSFEQFTDARGQTSLMSSMTLDRKQVGVNKDLLITMESKGKVLASSRFKILGVGDKLSGKVDFSEDEANGKKSDDE